MTAGGAAGQDRGLSRKTRRTSPAPPPGRSWLVLIAISDYRYQQPLRGPRNDARALKRVLFKRYDFSARYTVELYDRRATAKRIRATLRGLINKLAPNDRVLIYYAGHGYTDPDFNTGYFIPYDGGRDVDEKARWLPNASIRGIMSKLKARQALLIADSCFSGDLLQTTRSARTRTALDRAMSLRARVVLTSGSSEPVADTGFDGHSPFAYHLLDALRSNRAPVLDPVLIYDRVRRGVPESTLPLLGGLKSSGHQRGATYPFLLKGALSQKLAAESARADRAAAEAAWREIKPFLGSRLTCRRKRDELTRFIRDFPENNPHLKVAQARLAALNCTAGATAAGPVASNSKNPTAPPTASAKLTKDRPPSAIDTMVKIPGGEFLMGCEVSDPRQCGGLAPGERASVDTFWIDQTEVTVGAYRRCEDTGHCGVSTFTTRYDDADCNWGYPDREHHPMNCVSWVGADAYCRAQGKRLPTHEEWEKAARGIDGRRYPWGNESRSCDRTVSKCEGRRSLPVGSRTADASPYGALDMMGSVAEWTSARRYLDRYGRPTGAGDRLQRQVRGAPWGRLASFRKVQHLGEQYWLEPTKIDEAVGFRCVSESAPTAPKAPR